MDNNTVSMQIDGLEELNTSLNNLIKRYPDKAGELLTKQAQELRKDVVQMVKNDLDYNSSAKRSLSKVKEYSISAVQGYGKQQYVEISAKAPHFHLIENGHQLVQPRTRTITLKDGSKRKITLKNGGQVKGFVPGYNFMDRASKKRQINIPQELDKMIDKLLEEEGFI